MKFGPYLLINLIVVGGGLFIYDSLKGDASDPASDVGAFDPLQADDVGQPPEPSRDAPAMLSGGGSDVLAARISHLEQTLDSLRRQMGSRPTGEIGSSSGGPAVGSGERLPSFASEDHVVEDAPVYDEKTLATINSYMEEIQRRKNEERQRNRVTAELERQGLDLSDSQAEAVVEQTLAYQTKSRDLLRKGWPRDEAGRDSRRKAFEVLKEEYSTVIHNLVPAADAEKIMGSRISRGMGFFANGNTSRRASSGGKTRGKERRNRDR